MTQLIRLDQVVSDPAQQKRLRGGAISIGNFDGVHLGHQELLRHVRREADRLAGPAIAIVLDPHPASVLRPHGAPPALTALPRRAELMTAIGIDYLLVCEATRNFLNQTADEFFHSLIVDTLAGQALVEGPNFFFGRDRTGNVTRLRELCEAHDIQLTIVEPSVRDDRLVSSSRIREAIASGEIALANEMLGSIYRVSGKVASGEGRGRQLGFPTANLVSIAEMLPENGVYAGRALTADGGQRIAAIHIGPNPTFDEKNKTKVEVHLLDYDGGLYDQILTVELIHRVREVRKFADASELVAQMKKDLTEVRHIVSSSPF
ncbi:bifunctional riboflavin kinase/FAD synthetase [Neorhodopirellula pilleata]|uniref:Riboflavin biosynthesis protein n=1 Tax=Neorhodopirellula pilleata TaxID=2714738 RepID=A0A5C5ZPW4_9BACT|nr:bifunctional riboflavin kinase/FAD synthetase [Neorhodopirellula pilleata]TWT89524.1 Riboflavin kinase [Neorhodopirellula pilleata]